MTAPPSRRGEFELIAQVFAPLSQGAPGAHNLKDDVALVDVTPGHQLVVKTDAVVAGVHFRADDPPDLVARKALRVNLSDLAGKGARPLGFLQSLTLNATIDDAYLERYAAGLAEDVKAFRVPLVGGDTTVGPGPFTIVITALGEVPTDSVPRRSGAQADDLLYVTGTIGDAALGLACLKKELALADAHTSFLVSRYRLPQPRIAVGQGLRALMTASADVSDGLMADVAHICAASGVAARIERDAIPLSPAAQAAVTHAPQWWTSILGGGDDYEIAFAAPARHQAAIAQVAETTGIAITSIGRFMAPEGATLDAAVTVVDGAGRTVPVPIAGYRHR